MVKRRGARRKKYSRESWLSFLFIFLASFFLLSLILLVILSIFPGKERVQYLFQNLEKLGVPGLKSAAVTGKQITAQAFPTIGSQNIPIVCPVPTIYSIRDGNWNDPATWNLNRVPGDGDAVNISHKVIYNIQSNAGINCVNLHGVLNFSRSVDTRLMVGYLLVFPNGTLEVGAPGNPIPDGRIAEIVIRDVPLDLANDPDQFGTGLIGLGKVNMHGYAMNPTFVRLARAPRTGDMNFSLQQSVTGWKVGDKLILPDSNQYTDGGNRITYQRLEERTIQSISADGKTIAFSPALQYDHPGTTDENGDGQPDYLPHVANLRRNVIVRSETKTGTRGHVLFTDRAAVDIRYSAFVDLGRTTFNDLNSVTNHIGRYSLHMHHHVGPAPGSQWFDSQYQFRLVGNAIYEDSSALQPPPQKWGITIHHSNYGLIQDNIVYNLGGAGVVTEDGSESYNVFDHNFVVKIASNGGRIEIDDSGRGFGREGVGFWFRGPNNYVRNNVAANMGEQESDVEAAYGFKYQQQYLSAIGGAPDLHIPNFRGADTTISGQYTLRSGYDLHVLEFDNNEMYGNIQGLTFWWICTDNYPPHDIKCQKSVFRNSVIWHTMRYAYYGYPSFNYDFENFTVYGIPGRTSFNSIWFYGDYHTLNHTTRNSFFYGSSQVMGPYRREGSIRFENNYINTIEGFIHRTSASPGGGCCTPGTPGCTPCDLPDPDTILVNNRHVADVGQSLASITLDYYTPGQDPNNNDRLIVCNHNDVAGDNFEVFFPQKNNAPCTTTRADIANGYVCSTARADATCAGITSQNLIQPSDFEYQGSFMFPDIPCTGAEQWENYCWDYGGFSITYNPSGDPTGPNDGFTGSLFGSGHNGALGRIGEINIPLPSKNNPPRATTLQPITDIFDSVVLDTGGPSGTAISNMGGLLYVPAQGIQGKDLLYWSTYVFFDVSPWLTDFPSFGFSEPDLSKTNDARGPWRLVPLPGYVPLTYEYHQKRTSRYLFNVPLDFANQYLGGRSIIAGKANGPGLEGSSAGPVFIAFAPVSDINPPAARGSIPGQTLVMYDYSTSIRFPNWTESDRWSGATWIRAGGKNAVAIIAMKGMNTDYCYGPGTSNLSLVGTPVPNSPDEYCYDLCFGWKGYHNYPYEAQIALYDPQDLAAVSHGTKSPYGILPYTTFSLPEFSKQCGVPGGMSFDFQHELLYIVDGQAEDQDIRVYKINSTLLAYPIVTLSSPASGQTVGQNFSVQYSASGNLSGVSHVDLQLDGGAIIHDTNTNGPYAFTNIAVGSHTLRVFLVRSNEAAFANSEASVQVTFNVVQIVTCTNVDGDGWNATTGGNCGTVADCNDTDANINPGRAEICGDGIDNNCAGGIDEGCGGPLITITSPANNSVLTSSAVVVNYTRGGDLTGVTHTHLRLDSQPEVTGNDAIGSYTFIGVSDGVHVVYAYMASASDAQVGNRVYVNFIVNTGCGNGIVSGLEGCDDGNSVGSDGCSATCGIESGWSCIGQPSVCSRMACSFTNAYWSASSAIEGQQVTLTVEGSNCDGQQVNFAVYEDDILGGEKLTDDLVSLNPGSGVFANGRANTSWIAERQNDCFGLCNPPEYYFIATLGGDASVTRRSDAPLLSVSQGAVPCIDGDNDSWNATAGGSCGNAADCNDSASGINPAAVEICDGLDNNCVNGIDEGCGGQQPPSGGGSPGGGGGPSGSGNPPRNASQNQTTLQSKENETRFIPVENKSEEEEEIAPREGGEERLQIGENVRKNFLPIVFTLITVVAAIGVIFWFVWRHHQHEIDKIAQDFREQFSQ